MIYPFLPNLYDGSQGRSGSFKRHEIIIAEPFQANLRQPCGMSIFDLQRCLPSTRLALQSLLLVSQQHTAPHTRPAEPP